jgi:hypothetical protein
MKFSSCDMASSESVLLCFMKRLRRAVIGSYPVETFMVSMKYQHVQEVQFGGQAVKFRETTQWKVTWAVTSNCVAMRSPEGEGVCEESQRVNAFMHSHSLVHIGWLRVVSQGGPLCASDIHKQKV